MFTEDDVRAVCLEVADDAPTAHDIRDRVRTRTGTATTRRSRRVPHRALLIATAAAVATVVCVPVAVLHHRAAPAAERGGVSLRNWTFSLPDPSSFRVSDSHVDAGSQTIRYTLDGSGKLFRLDGNLVHSTGGHTGGSVTVYSAGRFDPASITAREPITVNGHAGFLGVVPSHSTADRSTVAKSGALGMAAEEPAVAWQYASGSWAVVQGFFRWQFVYRDNGRYQNTHTLSAVHRAGLLTIARSVRMSGSAITSPVTFPSLPSGYRVLAAGTYPYAPYRYGNARGAGFFAVLGAPAPSDTEPILSVAVSAITPSDTVCSAPSHPPYAMSRVTPTPSIDYSTVRIDGRTWARQRTFFWERNSAGKFVKVPFTRLSVTIGRVTVTITARDEVGEKALRRAASGLRVADLPWSTAHWFPAATALR